MKDKLIEIFNNNEYYPQNIDQLYELLSLKTSSEFTKLAKTLNELVDEKIIAYNEKGQFALLEKFNMIKGIIDVKDAGFAFVDTEIGGIFIPSGYLNGAITYDEVLIEYHFDKKGRYEGTVKEILKRNTTFIIGEIFRYKKKAVVRSVNPKIQVLAFIKEKDLNGAQNGEIVKVAITEYFPNFTVNGKVVEIYGDKDEKGLDITSLVLSAGVATEFSEETIKMAKSINQKINPDKLMKKDPTIRNLLEKMIITIDGDDAKDLDDAISLEYNDKGNYLLGVYIADVSYYVTENSRLDIEALERGTSIYLPDRVIPMLPKELSNGICSLNENEPRLVMACEMEIDQNGKLLNYDIFEAIIINKHRMTYSNVNAMLEEKNKEIRDKYYDIYPMLKLMNNLSKILNKKRIKKGSFEFETQEPKLVLDEKGKVVDITIRSQRSAEKLIEEFMLAANECVAEAMTWLNVPFIYRVHEEPKDEKINKLLMMLDLFGHPVKIKNKKSLPKMLQEVLLDLNEVEEKTEEEVAKDSIINKMMIRSMAKAKYQEYNIGHFGLASTCYTHFTSPIRRYPDLLVHRLIKEFMLSKKQIDVTNSVDYFIAKVHYAADNSSKTEKRAETLERDCIDMKKIEYSMQLIGKKFLGLISSITNFGIYITLDNTIEGLVKYVNMNDDYYEVDEKNGCVIGERTKKTYRLGDLVNIRIVDANIEKRYIYFQILDKEINRNGQSFKGKNNCSK